MNLDGCPPFLRPRLRLFLSADIVGSTALKQSPFSQARTEQRNAWFSKIQGFYFEAHLAFLQEFSRQKSLEEASLFGDDPTLWKTIGDEVLFVKVVTDHRQVIHTLRCWMVAIEKMRSFIKKGNERLDIKCTAWLAGFPFRNSEVAVESGITSATSLGSGDWFVEAGRALNNIYSQSQSQNIIVDYIGPSIDIGFRLTQFSSARKFVVSVDIAFVLAIANPGEMIKDPVFSIHYDGSESLKGVLGGLRYPVFWLDLSPSSALDRFEDGLTTLSPVDRDRLREYCNKFYEEHHAYIFPPFIYSESEQQIKKRPSWYDDDHSKLVQNFLVGEQEEASSGQLEPGEAAAENEAGQEATPGLSAEELESLIEDLLGHKGDAAKFDTT